MGFFDLNIPYVESPASDATSHKNSRLRILIKEMELGYTGVAFNRTMKGVMSDRDRCAIPLLTLSAVLKLAPSLSSSVNFHRDLLKVPRSSPFRQYTRLTVYADTIAQCQVLNSGNPVLKTYHLVAVRPLNQAAFDYACEKAEVDIISINFAENVPFRLKLPMIKAAIQRGVYFEITYSDLILDVRLRRQMVSNAKLLVDWTRGKNLILSSGASSVNVIRGPYDVANLSSLLGISMERAKAAVSKNCRSLLSNALRKKHFHKETIRVEPISSDVQLDSNKPLSGDWLKWDPICSGDGDLQLDDMAKTFRASTKVSNTVKTINFASVVDGISSQGFQVKDLMSGTQVVPQSQDSAKSNSSVLLVINESVAPNGASETYQDSLDHVPSNNQSPSVENDQECVLLEAIIDNEEVAPQPTIIEEQANNMNMAAISFTAEQMERDDQNSKHGISTHEVDPLLTKEIVKCSTSTTEIGPGAAYNLDAKLESDTLPLTFRSPAYRNEESKSYKSSEVDFGSRDVAMGEVGTDIKDLGDASAALDNVSLPDASAALDNVYFTENVIEEESFRELVETVSDINPLHGSCNEMNKKVDTSVHEIEVTTKEQRTGEQLGEPGDGRLLEDEILIQESCFQMIAKCDPSIANREAYEEVTVEEKTIGEQLREDVKMEEQIHGEADGEIGHPILLPCVPSEIDHRTLLPSVPGQVRAKPRMQCRSLPFPLKRMLNPLCFKRKARKFKHRITKM